MGLNPIVAARFPGAGPGSQREHKERGRRQLMNPNHLMGIYLSLTSSMLMFLLTLYVCFFPLLI